MKPLLHGTGKSQNVSLWGNLFSPTSFLGRPEPFRFGPLCFYTAPGVGPELEYILLTGIMSSFCVFYRCWAKAQPGHLVGRFFYRFAFSCSFLVFNIPAGGPRFGRI